MFVSCNPCHILIVDPASEKINCPISSSLWHGQFSHTIIRARAYRALMSPLRFITGHQVSILGHISCIAIPNNCQNSFVLMESSLIIKLVIFVMKISCLQSRNHPMCTLNHTLQACLPYLTPSTRTRILCQSSLHWTIFTSTWWVPRELHFGIPGYSLTPPEFERSGRR